jgi:hypothetical protein
MTAPDVKSNPIDNLNSTQNVDPIQYAWTRCNQGVSLPAVLVRSAPGDPVTARLGGQAAAARAATHSGIVRRRMPRPHKLA